MSRKAENNKQKFGIVPSFLAAQNVSANDIRVYIALSSYADRSRQCWPKVAHLCLDTGLSDRSVKRATSNLVEAGLIAKVANRGRGRPSLYILVDSKPPVKGGASSTHKRRVKGAIGAPLSKRKGCHSPTPQETAERVSPTGPAIEQTIKGIKGHLGQQTHEGENVIPFRAVAGGER